MNASAVNSIRIMTVVGARPQFIKAAVVSRAIQEHNDSGSDRLIQEDIIHTGQHYDYGMSDVFFEKLKIPHPTENLGINSCAHGEMTGRMMGGLEKVFKEGSPDWVMVYGDTNSTMAGALAAVKLHVPVAHVEAGLRSFNKKMPEEINRIVTDHVSDLLLCPTQTAVDNLKREGIVRGVHMVGDVMYDSVLFHIRLAESESPVLSHLNLKPGQYLLATIHRAENTNEPDRLRSIFHALDSMAENDLPVMAPLHPNTKKQIESLGLSFRHVQCIEAVSYFDMLVLEKGARMILTDSGGVQKEAYWFGVPCVTLREETEWVETVDSGCNVLAGADPDAIKEAVKKNCNGDFSRQVYGDGRAGRKIVELLIKEC